MMQTTSGRSLFEAVLRHCKWAIRDRFPRRKVTRVVQGVEMVLPWSHRLPDYASHGSGYGQNLVDLARALHTRDGAPITLLDVGANIGDSTLQVLYAVPGAALCVEGDPFYLEFLHLNVDKLADVEVVEALLSTTPGSSQMAPVRVGGTTRFEVGDAPDSLPQISTEDLRAQHPQFADLRLVKSDTDGHDVLLVPAIARTWSASRPVLFFEYDHELTRKAGNDPLGIWAALSNLGYDAVAVWDNGAKPLGRAPVAEMPRLAASLDRPFGERQHHYWDVAVVHAQDAVAQAALLELMPGLLVDPS